MITKLTPEQEAMVDVVRQEYIDLCDRGTHGHNKKKAIEAVEYLYKAVGKKVPHIIVCDSPLGALFAKEILQKAKQSVRASVWDSVRDSVRDSVWDSVGDSVLASVRDSVRDSVWDSVGDSVLASVRASVGDSVRASVRASVWDSVWDSVGASVGDSVLASVRASVWDSVRASVRASVGDSVLASVRASVGDSVGASVGDSVRDSVGDSVGDFWWTGCWDYGWCSFYKFFTHTKIVKHDKFEEYDNIVTRSGIWSILGYENVCIVAMMPTAVGRDNQMKLHSETGYAVTFADGYGQHYLSGVFFPVDVYESLVSGKMGVPNILKLENVEQRMAALKFIGAEKLLEQCNAILIDESERGNRLYRIDDLDGLTVHLVRFKCPSTAREYVHFVDHDNWVKGKERQADQAVAAMFDWNLEQYDKLEWES